MNPLALLALGIGALALAGSSPGPRTARPRRGGAPVGKWTENSGVVLSEAERSFLEQLVSLTSVPVHVTSGTRTYRKQASAMLAKFRAGGAAELFEVYPDDVIGRLLAVPATVEDWTAQITAIADTGAYFTGGHLAGRALDLRTHGLTDDQVAQLVTDCESLGASTLLEDAPPHLHVGVPAPT